MNPETNPYIPAAGSRPPVLAGREQELDTSTVALGRLGKGVHARSMILDGVRGVGKTVLLREFNYIARELGWITSGVVECDEGEQLPRIVAKLCHRALRDLETDMVKNQATQRSTSVEETAAQNAQAASNTRLIERLRQARPTGRVVMPIEPDAMKGLNLYFSLSKKPIAPETVW